MKAGLRWWTLAWSVLVVLTVCGQNRGMARHEGRLIDHARLSEGRTDAADGGRITPGVDLKAFGRPRFATGDDSTYATRELIDTAWAAFQGDSSLGTGGVIWIRYHVNIDPDL